MMGNGDPDFNEEDAKSYAMSGKIMLTAIVILFFIVILMICLHLYARWFLVRTRRRGLRRHRHHRRSHLVFYVDPATSVVASSRGLDSSLLLSLPVFVYSSKTQPEPVECPVCLSEFEEGETGRVLPKCNHSFHIDCIDMWFKTHSTCPICRAPVEPAPADDNRPEVVITVCEPEIPEPGSTSGLCEECQQERGEENQSGHTVSSSSSSIGFRRKPSSLVGVALEVPRRNESFGDESGCESPSTQSSFRSPMSRMLSFKRMLSRDRKANLSPSSGSAVGCSSSVNELEKERGGRDETQ